MYTTHFAYSFVHRWAAQLLLPFRMLWTRVCRYLLEFLLSLLSGIYSEVEWLDHKITLNLTIGGITISFSIADKPLYSPTGNAQRF